MSRLPSRALAVLAAVSCAAAPSAPAAPVPAAAAKLQLPVPLAPLAARPLQPPLALAPPSVLPEAAPLLWPFAPPPPLLRLRQTQELQAPPREGPPEPKPGQAGKDVIWLPTPEPLVERMLTMAQVGPDDVVYDLGSGDGRTVIAAARRGASAVGVEFNPDLVATSESRARVQGVAQKARFVRGDIFETDFSRATVVTLYLLSTLNLRLRPTLLKMRPGTRVVSHAFTMEDWPPDEVSQAEYRSAYLWIVPASVEGAWRLDLEGQPALELDLTQRFQRIEGTVALGAVTAGLREPLLRGERIRFGYVDARGDWNELDGTVAGERMSGTFRAKGRTGRWSAVRH